GGADGGNAPAVDARESSVGRYRVADAAAGFGMAAQGWGAAAVAPPVPVRGRHGHGDGGLLHADMADARVAVCFHSQEAIRAARRTAAAMGGRLPRDGGPRPTCLPACRPGALPH